MTKTVVVDEKNRAIEHGFAKENSALCIRIAKQELELAKLRDLLAQLLCWPVWEDLREGQSWKQVIAATLSEPNGEKDAT